MDVIELCLGGQSTLALTKALSIGDLTAVAVVALCDKPDSDRLTALLDQPDGPAVAAELTIAVVERGVMVDLMEVLVDSLATRAETLPLTVERGERVAQALLAATDRTRARHLLGWVAVHDPAHALALAIVRLPCIVLRGLPMPGVFARLARARVARPP